MSPSVQNLAVLYMHSVITTVCKTHSTSTTVLKSIINPSNNKVAKVQGEHFGNLSTYHKWTLEHFYPLFLLQISCIKNCSLLQNSLKYHVQRKRYVEFGRKVNVWPITLSPILAEKWPSSVISIRAFPWVRRYC